MAGLSCAIAGEGVRQVFIVVRYEADPALLHPINGKCGRCQGPRFHPNNGRSGRWRGPGFAQDDISEKSFSAVV